MEGATIPRQAVAPAAASPPGSKLPSFAQLALFRRDPLGRLIRLHRRYGDVFVVSFPFPGRLVYLADPALVKQLFLTPPEVVHAGEVNSTVLKPAMGDAAVNLDEAKHVAHRKRLLPPFHGERLQQYSELARAYTLEEMKRWPVGKPFPLLPHTQRITMAVIMRAVFGLEDRERFARFEQLNAAFSWRVNVFTAPESLRRDLGRWSPWARFMRARGRIDAFIYEQIALRREENEGTESGGEDLLGLLLEARHEDGSPMSDLEMRDELAMMLGAGHETSATSLAWAMERLLRAPEALGRLRESIAAGEDDYLAAAVKETLRMRPPIIDVGRKLTQPMRIGDYELPDGTFLMAAVAPLHYREDLFPAPYEFRPERFLDGKADTYSWIPFGGGMRRCIGAAFAEHQMRIVLRTILEHADLRAPDPKPERVRPHNMTLDPGRGARVVLEQPLR